MPGKYCAGCGERKRITWRELFCTQRCAAEQHLSTIQADGDMGYCPGCGAFADSCGCVLGEIRGGLEVCPDCLGEWGQALSAGGCSCYGEHSFGDMSAAEARASLEGE